MSLIARIADRLILCPSRHHVDAEGKRREWINSQSGRVEAWVGCFPDDSAAEPVASVIKFPGTAGRAERAGVHPAEIWGVNVEIWTINPHGYGGSQGSASIKKFPEMASSVYRHIAGIADRPVIVVGNSLGCLSALFVAAHHNIAALILRNPPPIRNMIPHASRYRAWNFGLSRLIADQVPEELDAIVNSSKSNAPCLFIQSGADRVIPVSYQNLIYDAYSGVIEKFVIYGADHHELVEEQQQEDYFAALRWISGQADITNQAR